MVRWAVEDGPVGGVRGCQRAGSRPARASDLPVVGRRRVELVLRAGLGIREVEGGGLIEVGPTLRVGARGPEAGPRACGWIVIGAWLPVYCSVPSGGRGWGELRAGRILYEQSGLARFLEWLRRPASPAHAGGGRLRAVLLPLVDYVISALQVIQVLVARLAVLTLSMPVFLLLSIVALVDGLVQRDLRRWGGGRESSFVYHWAKRSALPLWVFAWVAYLAAPVTVHPSVVVIPLAVLFAASVAV